MDTTARSDERNRLNRRIRILPKELAVDLKYYRKNISSMGAVQRRHAAVVFIPREGQSGFLEAEDVVPLCHKFLDQFQVPVDPDLNHPKLTQVNL